MSAVRGIEPWRTAQALNTPRPSTDLAQVFEVPHGRMPWLGRGEQELGFFDKPAADLRQLDLAAQTMRSQACAEERAGCSGLNAATGVTPPPTATDTNRWISTAPLREETGGRALADLREWRLWRLPGLDLLWPLGRRPRWPEC